MYVGLETIRNMEPFYMSCLLKDMLLFAQLKNGLAGAQTLGVYAPNQCLPLTISLL